MSLLPIALLALVHASPATDQRWTSVQIATAPAAAQQLLPERVRILRERRRQTLHWSGELPGDQSQENCDCEQQSWGHRHQSNIAGQDSPPGVDLPAPNQRRTITHHNNPSGGNIRSGSDGGGGNRSGNGGSAGGNTPGGFSNSGNAGAFTARASGGNLLVVDTGNIGNPLGTKIIGAVNLGGSEEVLDEIELATPTGGLLRINLPLFKTNPVPAVARQLRKANHSGWKTLVTVMGTPEHLATNFDGVDLGRSIPPYARSVPSSPGAWADEVVAAIHELQSRTGTLPDYLEIGNEPDRVEYWDGTLADYLALYSAASTAIRGEFPSIKVGGMGLAGSESNMSGSQSALLALQEFACNNQLPLDFLSWHNYGMSTQMRYSGIVDRLRSAAGESQQSLELLVSEWNIEPNALAGNGSFDRSLGAANYAAFAATSADLGLDGSCFFMLHDIDDQSGIQDLNGQSIGAMSKRGIKKPSWRMMEIINQMATQAVVPVSLPQNEFAIAAFATVAGNNLRIVIANESVEPEWVFANGCRESGILPGEAATRIQAAGLPASPDLNSTQLLGAGFNSEETIALLAIFAEVRSALELKQNGRDITLEFANTTHLTLLGARRFDSTHNAPANHLENLLPHLELVESAAISAAIQAGDNFLIAEGYSPVSAVPDLSLSISELASTYNLSEEIARVWRNTGNRVLRSERLNTALFESLPGSALEPLETPVEAGLSLDGNRLSLHLEADSVTIIELAL